MMNLPSIDSIVAEQCLRSFRRFAKEYWPLVVTDELIDNWLVDCICDHLEAVYRGQISRLLINIPPGLGKSVLMSVMFPAWVWAVEATMQFICCTSNNSNLRRDSIRFYNLTNDRKYVAMFGDFYTSDGSRRFKMSEDMNNIINFKKGQRAAMTTSSRSTGKRGKIILNDDPNDISDINSKKGMDSSNDFTFKRLANRNFAKLGGAYVLLQQRLAKNDASSIAIEMGWDHLMIPMEFNGRTKMVLNDWEDPRKHQGDFINDSIFDGKSKDQMIKMMSRATYMTQYQQEPSDNLDSMFKREWFQYFDKLPASFDDEVSCCDTSLKGKANSDYMAILTCKVRDGNFYFTNGWRDKVDFIQALDAYREYYAFDKVLKKGVEDAANGPAIYSTMKDEIPGMFLWPHDDLKSGKYEGLSIRRMNKKEKATLVLDLFRDGRVFVPRETNWGHDLIEEAMQFPDTPGSNDDMVDAMIACLITLTCKKEQKLEAHFSFRPDQDFDDHFENAI